MQIESIEKYKGDTFCVTIETVGKIYLNKSLVAEYGLEVGDEITKERLGEILYASELRRASRRAMYLINERDYSYIKLFEKLRENYSEEICYDVVNNMAKKGYINDKRYAEQIVYSYMNVKCFGPMRVKQELYKRGIRGAVAEEALESGRAGLRERLFLVIEKKYDSALRDSSDKRTVLKVKNSLARMGYEFDDINNAVNEYLKYYLDD